MPTAVSRSCSARLTRRARKNGGCECPWPEELKSWIPAASSTSGIGTAWPCGKFYGRPESSCTLRKPAVISREPCDSTWLPGAPFCGRPEDARKENYKRPHGPSRRTNTYGLSFHGGGRFRGDA